MSLLWESPFQSLFLSSPTCLQGSIQNTFELLSCVSPPWKPQMFVGLFVVLGCQNRKQLLTTSKPHPTKCFQQQGLWFYIQAPSGKTTFVVVGRCGFWGGGGSFILACWEWGGWFCLSGVVWRWLGCGWGEGRLGVGGVFLSGAVLGTFLVRDR